MRIVHLTPGTGNFYCGSCLRDNTLVKALRARGHDVLMVPLYLPVVTDEPAASADTPIFLGGLNVYLEQKLPLFHGARWLDAPWLLRVAAKLNHLTRARDVGELALSMLRGESRELDKLIAWLKTQPAPDVICLSNSLLAGLARRLRQEFNVPVVTSLQGEDSFLDALAEPYRPQAWQLLRQRCADLAGFIAPSRYYADQMAGRLGLKSVAVVPNGIVLDGYEPAAPAVPTIGYLTRMHPSKGLDKLVEAFVQVRARLPEVRLLVAGAQTASDRQFVRALQRRAGPAAEFHPNPDRAAKLALLRRMSVFSVPATYGEAFGLYLLEALACGVPVVQPRHGAFPELIEATGGGVLCEPGELADALESLLRDPDRARQLGATGRAAVREKFSADAMARQFETVLREVLHAA